MTALCEIRAVVIYDGKALQIAKVHSWNYSVEPNYFLEKPALCYFFLFSFLLLLRNCQGWAGKVRGHFITQGQWPTCKSQGQRLMQVRHTGRSAQLHWPLRLIRRQRTAEVQLTFNDNCTGNKPGLEEVTFLVLLVKEAHGGRTKGRERPLTPGFSDQLHWLNKWIESLKSGAEHKSAIYKQNL